ncbi:MAG TPA: MlaD family protein [Azospirillaceae bacterium]|nr:MlaD family protein [Azospirillaceae bacterium]
METKASYALVGAFVLALTAALFVTVLWLARSSLNEATQPYRIYFTGTVNGLVNGSPVRYRGVSVGSVTDIRINPDNVEQVQVTVSVPQTTPIKTDAVASLEPVGVTGGVYVEIQGGSRDAPLLRETTTDIPVIPSRAGSLNELLAAAPQLLSNLIKLSESVAGFVTPENQKAVSAVLANMASASKDASTTMKNADKLMADLRENVTAVSKQTQTLLANANDTVTKVGSDAQEVSGELAKTSEELRLLTQSLVTTADQLNAMIAENREPIRDFTNGGLYEFGLLVGDLRDLAGNLSRVTTRIENDPSNFLFGGRKDGVKVK